jgi:hypothetical protein
VGHSRPDTTQQYPDEVELDDLAEALEKAAETRDAQASPDLATLESEVAKGLKPCVEAAGIEPGQGSGRPRAKRL